MSSNKNSALNRLIVAEKPSVAQSISKVLGVNEKKMGIFKATAIS